jgi:uncharacterized protein (DUF1778 family)
MEAETKRWDIRVDEHEDRLVRAAADLTDTKLSSFVRSAAVTEAHRILIGEEASELDHDASEDASVPEGLVELFSKPSVFK